MLTLADSLRVGSTTLFRDAIYRGGGRSYGNTFYALPAAPRLARDPQGVASFDFTWYRAPPAGEAAPAAGGLAILTIELAPSPAEQEALAVAAAAALGGGPSSTPLVVPVPFKAGTVELSFAGEAGTGGELASALAGSGPARLAGDQRATFAVELTRDGAALLWQALQDGADLFHARYDLVFEHRLDAVELRVWCDAKRAWEAAAARQEAAPMDPPGLAQRLVVERLAGCELVSSQPLEPSHRQALEELGQRLLAAAVGSAFFAPEPAGTVPAAGGGRRLRPFDPAVEATLNHTFSEAYPVEQHAVLEGILSLGLGPAELAQRVRRVDLDGGFFRLLEVQIYCTVDFARDPVAAVKVTIDYDEEGTAGRVQRSGEFLFRGSETAAVFRTELAAPDRRSVRWRAEVYYPGSPQPMALTFPPAETTAIVLDLDALGVLRVRVGLRDVPLATVRSVVIDLEYPTGGIAARLILDGETPSEVWQVVVREAPRPYRYRVAWLTADGRRLEEEWRTAGSAELWLDAPADLVRQARVQVVAAGSFSELAQIVVDLRDTASGNATQLALASPGESLTWEPPAADPAFFRYQARRTLVYRDGTVRRLDWTDEDRPVLVVRDDLRFAVRVVPRLLDLGASLRLALLNLEYRDAAGEVKQRATLVLRDRAEEPEWSFRLEAPERRAYRYSLTLIPAAGPRTDTPWRDAQEAILVLRAAAE